jgi:hypothetical protein
MEADPPGTSIMIATRPTRGEVALARAVLYRLCAQALRHPDGTWLAEWHEIARGVGAALEVLASEGWATGRMHAAYGLARAAACDLERLRLEHARLIGPPPRAGATLCDLAGSCRAFGLALSRTCDERVDHLALELAHLQLLCLKGASAEERGLDDLGAAMRARQMKFLGEQVLSWACACGTRLRGLGAETFYGHAATLLEAFLWTERVRFGLASEDETVPEPATN